MTQECKRFFILLKMGLPVQVCPDLKDKMYEIVAQDRMKLQADKHRQERCFEEGDWVLQKIGTVAYKLELPPESGIHPIFHVSCLKAKLGQHITPIPTLRPVDDHEHLSPAPKGLLQQRTVQLRRRPVTEVLVHWEGSSAEDATWELLSQLQQQYPHLVGKVL
ncbi:uncharacterized protein LOC142620321 [Castanea sativa]|uniref:uncharacterized protein LOC142620321 n=1 Tax=Castanea sativa TaxID=21020 RepID=UPI003F650424